MHLFSMLKRLPASAGSNVAHTMRRYSTARGRQNGESKGRLSMRLRLSRRTHRPTPKLPVAGHGPAGRVAVAARTCTYLAITAR